MTGLVWSPRRMAWCAAASVSWVLVAMSRVSAQTDGADFAKPGPLDSVVAFVVDVFRVSTENLAEKLTRIVSVLVIVGIAMLLMGGIRKISRFMVYSDWGPLKYIARNHQRSITLHSLIINLTKYIVYFTALGYILNELGVNYTTFLASLSLVGIAIGFGSQGLVQDVVTGFFILFENQFSVNDMVEISGQIGVVEEIGLRTTRIRNYFGADVILQNRNIPSAIRYSRGGIDTVVDVSIVPDSQGHEASLVLHRAGEELGRQFEEIILDEPKLEGVFDLETGERFVRITFKLWPGQQWLVDQQLLPRIREAFKRAEIEIPGDRIVAFYHKPEIDRPSGSPLIAPRRDEDALSSFSE